MAVSRASALPVVQPMQPVLTKPFHRDGWIYKEKYHSWRMLEYKEGRSVRLISRRGLDHTERFAEIATGVRRLPARTLILDGEVCVCDDQLLSRSHMHLLMDPPADGLVTSPCSWPSTASTRAAGTYVDGRSRTAGKFSRTRWMVHRSCRPAPPTGRRRGGMADDAEAGL
jgi:hypothetical protein